jgi:hypothetical protein
VQYFPTLPADGIVRISVIIDADSDSSLRPEYIFQHQLHGLTDTEQILVHQQRIKLLSQIEQMRKK